MIRLVFIAIIYFPGTVLHEFSHYAFAKLLGVPVHGFSVMPRFIDRGMEFGHVRIQRVDIFRRGLIAIAPMIVGIISFGVAVYIFMQNDTTTVARIGLGYFLLCILNMMVPSREDFRIARPAITSICVIVCGVFIVFLLRSLGILP